MAENNNFQNNPQASSSPPFPNVSSPEQQLNLNNQVAANNSNSYLLKKKPKNKKPILIALTVFVLSIAVASGMFLVNQQQELRRDASVVITCDDYGQWDAVGCAFCNEDGILNESGTDWGPNAGSDGWCFCCLEYSDNPDEDCSACPEFNPDTRCTSSSECSTGEICDTSTGTCIVNPTPECVVDDDCSAGQTCTNGVCFTPNATPIPAPECSSDSECDMGEICETSTGTCIVNPTPECVVDDDCSAGQTCTNGVCFTPNATPLPTPECAADVDCASGHACITQTGVCVDVSMTCGNFRITALQPGRNGLDSLDTNGNGIDDLALGINSTILYDTTNAGIRDMRMRKYNGVWNAGSWGAWARVGQGAGLNDGWTAYPFSTRITEPGIYQMGVNIFNSGCNGDGINCESVCSTNGNIYPVTGWADAGGSYPGLDTSTVLGVCTNSCSKIFEVVAPSPTPAPTTASLSCPVINRIECAFSNDYTDDSIGVWWTSVPNAVYQLLRDGVPVPNSNWITWESLADVGASCGVSHTYRVNVKVGEQTRTDCPTVTKTCPCDSPDLTSCLAIQLYLKDDNDNYFLPTQDQIVSLGAGDEIYFGVSYSGDNARQARVRVNADEWDDSHSTTNRVTINGANLFIKEYVIPVGYYNFVVEAQVL